MGLAQLPLEVLWRIFALLPSLLELRLVSRKFYHLHNELYMTKTLRIISKIDKDKSFWSELQEPIVVYIKSLDFLRKDARLIHMRTKNGMEFLDDSWFIIFSILASPWKCWDLEYQRLPYTHSCIVPAETSSGSIYAKTRPKSYPLRNDPSLPLNAWFLIDEPIAPSEMPEFNAEIRHLCSAHVCEMTSAPGSLAEITEKGVYCFNIGNISNAFWDYENGCSLHPLEIELKNIGLAPPMNSKKFSMTFLGYDFKSYGEDDSWIFFKCDPEFVQSIFNPYERCLEKRLAAFAGAPSSNEGDSRARGPGELIEPYFDVNRRAVRKFAYGYPQVEQDYEREWEAADWRAPHLLE